MMRPLPSDEENSHTALLMWSRNLRELASRDEARGFALKLEVAALCVEEAAVIAAPIAHREMMIRKGHVLPKSRWFNWFRGADR